MGRAINRSAEASKIDAWRLAHGGLVLGGIMLFAISSIFTRLDLTPILGKLLVWSFIVSTYGFIIALPYGASIGERGLQNTSGKPKVVYIGNMVGAVGSSIGGVVLVIGAAMAMLR